MEDRGNVYLIDLGWGEVEVRRSHPGKNMVVFSLVESGMLLSDYCVEIARRFFKEIDAEIENDRRDGISPPEGWKGIDA